MTNQTNQGSEQSHNQRTFQHLNIAPNIADPDTFYAKMIDMQAGLTDDDAQAAISQLLLVLANHIGDMDVLLEAIQLVNQEMADKKDKN